MPALLAGQHDIGTIYSAITVDIAGYRGQSTNGYAAVEYGAAVVREEVANVEIQPGKIQYGTGFQGGVVDVDCL